MEQQRLVEKHGALLGLPAVRTSPQAVYLQMAAAQTWGAAEFARLDAQTISRAHPDGMAQMLDRTEITCHFSSTPFQDRALAQPGVRELISSYAILGTDDRPQPRFTPSRGSAPKIRSPGARPWRRSTRPPTGSTATPTTQPPSICNRAARRIRRPMCWRH